MKKRTRKHLSWGAEPSATEIFIRGELNPDPDNIKTGKNHNYSGSTVKANKNTNHSRSENLLISKFLISIADRQLRKKKLLREKTLNIRTTVELIFQNSYDRRHTQSTILLTQAKDKELKMEPIHPKNTNETKPRLPQNKTQEYQSRKFDTNEKPLQILRLTEHDTSTPVPGKNNE